MHPPDAPLPGATPAAPDNASSPLASADLAPENFPLGLAAGLGAALLGGAVWAAVTVTTNFKIGWIAVGIGFLVGHAVRTAGRGHSQRFAIAGAALALLGCVLGNYFTVLGTVAGRQHLDFLGLLARIPPGVALKVMVSAFEPMDLLFYGIAVYEGYKFARRKRAA